MLEKFRIVECYPTPTWRNLNSNEGNSTLNFKKCQSTKIQFCNYSLCKKKGILPSHWKNTSHVFDITELTNNSFLCFQLLHFIHWSSSAPSNISHLSNKALVYLQKSLSIFLQWSITVKIQYCSFCCPNSTHTRKKWLVL